MTKHNKLRYQSKGNQFPRLIMSGNVFLKHEHEEEIAAAVKGDVMMFLNIENSPLALYHGDYRDTGIAGYLRADVHDGKGWRPLDINAFFPGREHHFRKTERPIDTYNLCSAELAERKGTSLARTYREHYTPE